MRSSLDKKLQTLTHILTHQTTTPSLHSQLFVSSQLPNPPPSHHLHYYPPLLSSSSSSHLLWSFSLFLRRLLPPPTSWRSKCPFQQPPPLVLSAAVEPAPEVWGAEERLGYSRRRLRRGRLGFRVPTLLAVMGPNVGLLLIALLWDPMGLREEG